MKIVRFNWEAMVILILFSHFVPPYLDYLICAALFMLNMRVIASHNFDVPLWLWACVLIEFAGMWSGLVTDYDPLGGRTDGVLDGKYHAQRKWL